MANSLSSFHLQNKTKTKTNKKVIILDNKKSNAFDDDGGGTDVII